MLHCFIPGWLVREVTSGAAVEAHANDNAYDQDLGYWEEKDVKKASKSRGVCPNTHHGHDCSKNKDSGNHGESAF